MDNTSPYTQMVDQIPPTSASRREIVKLPNIFQVIGEAFLLLKQGFWRFLLIECLNFLVLPLIGAAIAFGIGYIARGRAVGLISALLGFYIVFVLSWLWKLAVQINFCHQLSHGIKTIPFKRSIGYVLGILTYRIVFGILINIGFLAFIIPGVILAVMYFLTPYVYVLEEKRIFHAAGLASRYAKGYKFALLARLIAFILLWVLAMTIVWLILIVVGGGAFLLTGVFNLLTGNALSSFTVDILLIGLLLTTFLIVTWGVIEALQAGYFYKVYESLREIKQKAWLEGREVYDGYSLGKKLLVSSFAIILAVIFILSVIAEIKSKGPGANDIYRMTKSELPIDNGGVNSSFSKGSNDEDLDGLSDDEELQLGSNPFFKDTDGDSLNDFEEVKTWKTNYSKIDTDNDELSDFDEVKVWRTDPHNPDTDGDMYKDGEEVRNGYRPNGPGKIVE